VMMAAGDEEQSTSTRRPLRNLVARVSSWPVDWAAFSVAARLAASSSSTSKGDFCWVGAGRAAFAPEGRLYLRSVATCSRRSRAKAAIWGLLLALRRSSRASAASHFLLAI